MAIAVGDKVSLVSPHSYVLAQPSTVLSIHGGAVIILSIDGKKRRFPLHLIQRLEQVIP